MIFPMNPSIKNDEEARKNDSKTTVRADLCQGARLGKLAGFHEGLQMCGDLRRRELVEPVFVSRNHELPFADGIVEDQTNDTVNQCGITPVWEATAARQRERTGGWRRMALSSLRVLLVLSAADHKACNSR